jgi:shikimate kinase
MNLDNNPTVEQLRSLLRACDDQAGHHVLWVAMDGEVHITRVPKQESPLVSKEWSSLMKLRYETFEAGNDYVGPEAAKDDCWVKELFEALLKKWPSAKAKTSVELVGQF